MDKTGRPGASGPGAGSLAHQLRSRQLSRSRVWGRIGLGALRSRASVQRLGSGVLVTGARAVLEVLGREDDFDCSPAPPTGPAPPAAERAALSEALRGAARWLAPILDAESRRAAGEFASGGGGPRDLLADFSERVCAQALARCAGAAAGATPDPGVRACEPSAARGLAELLRGEPAHAQAFVRVVDEILRRPALRERVASAAAAGALDELRCTAWEALRFRPLFPLLTRFAVRAAVLAPGTPQQTSLAAGAQLTLAPLAALFDPELTPRPDAFDASRFAVGSPAARALLDLLFGSGPQPCPGREHAALALPLMLRALFSLPELRRAGPGRVRYEGARITRYELRPAS